MKTINKTCEHCTHSILFKGQRYCMLRKNITPIIAERVENDHHCIWGVYRSKEEKHEG